MRCAPACLPVFHAKCARVPLAAMPCRHAAAAVARAPFSCAPPACLLPPPALPCHVTPPLTRAPQARAPACAASLLCEKCWQKARPPPAAPRCARRASPPFRSPSGMNRRWFVRYEERERSSLMISAPPHDFLHIRSRRLRLRRRGGDGEICSLWLTRTPCRANAAIHIYETPSLLERAAITPPHMDMSTLMLILLFRFA